MNNTQNENTDKQSPVNDIAVTVCAHRCFIDTHLRRLARAREINEVKKYITFLLMRCILCVIYYNTATFAIQFFLKRATSTAFILILYARNTPSNTRDNIHLTYAFIIGCSFFTNYRRLIMALYLLIIIVRNDLSALRSNARSRREQRIERSYNAKTVCDGGVSVHRN